MLFFLTKFSFRIFIILFFFVLIFIIDNKCKNKINSKSDTKLINFSHKLCSKEEYNSIYCTKTLEVKQLSTSICIHDARKDYTSRMILLNGIKEKEFIELFLSKLSENADCLFIDIGAHVGMYTLFAAKLGRDVVAVEPFFDNIIRLQKAAKIEKLERRITLLNNAVSNLANVVVKLNEHKNIGEQSLFTQNSSQNRSTTNDRFTAKTIIFDDILSIVPKQSNGKEYEKAILKIDIEGFEPYAFLNASKVFEKFNFVLILMEWNQINKHRQQYMNEIELMISFLVQRQYIPFDNNTKLDVKSWLNWPKDIYWTRNN